MKKLKFLTDHVEQWARYKAGETPEQWFANEVADRLKAEDIAEIVEVDQYTTQCEAAAATAQPEPDPED